MSEKVRPLTVDPETDAFRRMQKGQQRRVGADTKNRKVVTPFSEDGFVEESKPDEQAQGRVRQLVESYKKLDPELYRRPQGQYNPHEMSEQTLDLSERKPPRGQTPRSER